MRFRRATLQRYLSAHPCVFGDCRCGHSFVYHAPLLGCAKCGCDEFR